ncbi:DUF4156 domain-containing protein [Bdellovibrionota bacterium]
MKKLFVMFAAVAFVIGCAATPINPGAQLVMLGHEKPDKACKYLGEAVGSQGGSFTGVWTSNVNMEIGAKNDLKNKAAGMGANYVQLLTQRAGDTSSYSRYGGGGGQTNVVYVGACYRCPDGTY